MRDSSTETEQRAVRGDARQNSCTAVSVSMCLERASGEQEHSTFYGSGGYGAVFFLGPHGFYLVEARVQYEPV